MQVHDLKSWPKFFGPIASGARTHELRRNDRNFAIGDRLRLREYEPELHTYSGRELLVEVTSMTASEIPCAVSDEALDPRFCILSVRLLVE